MVGSGSPLGVVFTRDNLVIQRDSGTVEMAILKAAGCYGPCRAARGGTATLAGSRDGSLLARLAADGTVSIADMATGDILATVSLPVPDGGKVADPWQVTALMLTPDGRDLLTASSGGQLDPLDTQPQ